MKVQLVDGSTSVLVISSSLANLTTPPIKIYISVYDSDRIRQRNLIFYNEIKDAIKCISICASTPESVRNRINIVINTDKCMPY
jgi:hypothetical protein